MQLNDFAKRLGLKVPLIIAPMAGGPSSSELVIASSAAGALGSVGAAYMTNQAIEDFTANIRSRTKQPIAINLFLSHGPLHISEFEISRAVQSTEIFRSKLGIPKPSLTPPYEENFDEQFEAVLKVKPEVFSFVFGILKSEYLNAAKKENIFIIGTATTVDEAMELQESGVDAITLQGFEGGGHRGIFDSAARDPEISTLDLLEQCLAKIKIPLIAAGGIMTSQDVQKMLSQGAQAVQMGTAFLTCKEAGTSEPYRRALLDSGARKTKTTRAFSGRLARGMENSFMIEMEKTPEAILPFPAQNKFTRDIRTASTQNDSSEFLSLWAGSGKGELWTGSAADLIANLFEPASI